MRNLYFLLLDWRLHVRLLLLFLLLLAISYTGTALTPPGGGSFLERESTLSLSGVISSPERYAHALNLTVEQVAETKRNHVQAAEDLHQLLQQSDLSGTEKHHLLCRHRFRYGSHPFLCHDCWSYIPVCVCHQVGDQKRRLPANLEVVVWTHHGEWGLTSNTGCLLAKSLTPCNLWMKGLPEHDQQMEQLLADNTCQPVVLWAADSKSETTTPPSTITLDEILEKTHQLHQRVVLIAVDASWRNARRMVARLPANVPRLDLSANIVLPGGTQHDKSILAPLRSRGPGTSQRQVCTAEAVVGALLALGLKPEDGAHVLDITKKKVDLIRRYRGKDSGNKEQLTE
jgi:DTW domain-containing protein YfiP